MKRASASVIDDAIETQQSGNIRVPVDKSGYVDNGKARCPHTQDLPTGDPRGVCLRPGALRLPHFFDRFSKKTAANHKMRIVQKIICWKTKNRGNLIP
jgi:hypothetical protein